MSFANQDIHNAAGPASSAEPSMEEILASIRRILKEDEPGRPVGVVEMPEVAVDDDILLLDESMVARPADVMSATMLPAESFPVSGQPAAVLQARVEPLHFSSEPVPFGRDFEPAGRVFPEPVVDLAPVVEASGEPVVGVAGGGLAERGGGGFSVGDDLAAFASRSELNSARETELADDYVAVARGGGVPAVAEPAEVWSAVPEPVYAAARPQPEFNGAVSYSRESIQTEPVMNDSTSPDGFAPPHSLISEKATDAAASSIGALVRSMTAEKSVAISRSSSITIEDIVREEIRPMLKSWLDANLPSLVERIVRSEIERVINRSVL